jgi:hypothetical protein
MADIAFDSLRTSRPFCNPAAPDKSFSRTFAIPVKIFSASCTTVQIRFYTFRGKHSFTAYLKGILIGLHLVHRRANLFLKAAYRTSDRKQKDSFHHCGSPILDSSGLPQFIGNAPMILY